MLLKDFDYELPEELIAQTPIEPRNASRLMVLDPALESIEHRHFYDLSTFLAPGDALILNDTRVLPARLHGRREPTAGLHFTREQLAELKAQGIHIGFVTLHVGLGTFRPVNVEKIEEHKMHSEYYQLPEETADLISRTKAAGGRVIAVGTTSIRTLESAAGEQGTLAAKSGWTDIFIYPGYRFKIVDALVTNFHLPKSTLLMLISAFAGREFVLHAYEEAVREKYRFFSFGDAMFLRKRG